MLEIGITGGIGSGKTTVCKIFMQLGIEVYFADDRAKWLMNNHPDLKKEIISLFGEESYLNGELKRSHISKIAFTDTEKLKKLNESVHPRVFDDYKKWSLEMKEKGHKYILKEAALLFESGSYKELDYIICVVADEEIRIKRVMERDGISRDEVLQRINKQMKQEEKMKLSKFIIQNNGEESLIEQVIKIDKELKKLYNNHL